MIGYTKTVTKKGTGRVPSKGDYVYVRYTGTLNNGTVFDTNAAAKVF